MAENELPPDVRGITSNRWAWIGCGLVILFIIAFIVVFFFVGFEAASPMGEQPGPGP